MNPSVRKLGPGDAAAARQLVRAFHSRTVSDTHLCGVLSDPANILLVAESAGKVFGFAWAHWLVRLARESQHLLLYEIEVDARHQRKGIGRELMNAILSEANSKQAEVFVFTNHSNPGAVSFYKSLGGVPKNGDDLLFVYPYGGAA
jgi:ribosomal protein S18 acetylase RimI-like enzyme